jgi:hypothetical protein
MLVPTTRTAAYGMLWQFGLIHPILRDLPASGDGALQEARSVLAHLPEAEPISFGLATLALMIDYRWHRGRLTHDVLGNLSDIESAKLVAAARRSLKLSNDLLEEMADVARWTHRVLNVREPSVALLKRFLARPHAAQARQLLAALARVGAAPDRITTLQARLAELSKTDFAPAPLLTGDDLVAAGYAPGKAFKKVLEDVYDAQLESRVATKSDALAMARGILK